MKRVTIFFASLVFTIFSFSSISHAKKPEAIHVSAYSLLNTILIEENALNWEYVSFAEDFAGILDIIAITRLHDEPRLLSTKSVFRHTNGHKNTDYSLFQSSLNERVGRFALKFELEYKTQTQRNAKGYFFMVYKAHQEDRIDNLLADDVQMNENDISYLLGNKFHETQINLYENDNIYNEIDKNMMISSKDVLVSDPKGERVSVCYWSQNDDPEDEVLSVWDIWRFFCCFPACL